MSFVVFEIHPENQIDAYLVKRDADFLKIKAKNGHEIQNINLELEPIASMETSVPFLIFRESSPVRQIGFEGIKLKRYQYYRSENLNLSEGQGLILTEDEARQYLEGVLTVDCGDANEAVRQALSHLFEYESRRIRGAMHKLITSLTKQAKYKPTEKEEQFIQDLLDK